MCVKFTSIFELLHTLKINNKLFLTPKSKLITSNQIFSHNNPKLLLDLPSFPELAEATPIPKP